MQRTANHNTVVATLYEKKKKKIRSTSFPTEICTLFADMRI